jgi:hypothetical protein
MRLNTLLALMTLGAGYAALTACDGGDKPENEADTDTDTDADADSDADADVDTAPTGALGPLVWIGFAGGGTYDIASDTYGGVETFGVYEFNDQVNPQIGDETALCEFSWPASNPTPAPGTCANCEWSANVTMGVGSESGPAGGCATFGIDATVNEGASFGYGYDSDYDYQGEIFPILMYYSQTNMEWGPGTDLGVAYDETTGAFDYIFLSDYGYL